MCKWNLLLLFIFYEANLFSAQYPIWKDSRGFQAVLDIQYETSPDEKVTPETKEEFRKICASFFDAWTPGGGPWGLGLFTNYRCFVGDEKLEGENIKTRWKFSIKQVNENLEFRFMLNSASENGVKPIDESIKISGHPFWLQALQDKEVILHVVTLFGLRIPMIGRLTVQEIFGRERVFLPLSENDISHEKKIPEPPQNLEALRLLISKNGEKIKIKKMGEINLVELSKKEKREFKMRTKVSPPKRGWFVGDELSEKIEKQTILLQVPEPLKSQLKEMMNQSLMTLWTRLLSTLENQKGEIKEIEIPWWMKIPGFDLSFRMGYPYVGESIVLPKLQLYHFAYEPRLTNWSGLQFASDIVPKVSDTFEDEEYYLGWQRYSLSYLTFIDPGYWIDRIEFLPKLGLWTLEAKMPAEGPVGGLESRLYEINFNPSMGYELGLYWATEWGGFRLWYTRDFTGSVRQTEKESPRVDLERLGGAINFSSFTWRYATSGEEDEEGRELEVQFLVHVIREGFLLTGGQRISSEITENQDDEDGIRKDFFYNFINIGLGSSVSW